MRSGSRGRRLAGNAVSLAAGGVAAQLAYIAIEAFIARRLGVESYGTFSTAFTYSFVLLLVLDMGMNARLLQDATRDLGTAGKNLGTMMALKIVAFLVVFPLVMVAFSATDYGEDFRYLMAILAVYALVATVQDALAAVFNAQQRMHVSALFQAGVPMLTLLALFVAARLRGSLTLDLVGASYLAAMAATTLVWLLITIRALGSVRAEFSHVGRVISGSYLYGLTTLLSQFSFRSGIIVLSLMRDWTSVAVFAAAFRLVSLGYKLPEMAARVLTPSLFSDRYHHPEIYAASCNVMLRLAVVSSCATGLLLFVTGRELSTFVFGDGFSESGRLLQGLGISLALKVFSGLAQTVLVTSDEHAFRARAVAMAAVLNIGMSVPLVSVFGAMGAVIGVIAGDLFLGFLVWRRLRYLLPSIDTNRLVLVPIGATGFVALGLFMAQVPWLYGAIVGLLVYFSLIVVSGYFGDVFQAMRSGRGRAERG